MVRPRTDPGAEAKWTDGVAKVSVNGEGAREEGVLDVYVEGDVSISNNLNQNDAHLYR